MVLVCSLQLKPPLIPPKGEVNAADAFDIGSFDEDDIKKIKVYIYRGHCIQCIYRTVQWIHMCCL